MDHGAESALGVGCSFLCLSCFFFLPSLVLKSIVFAISYSPLLHLSIYIYSIFIASILTNTSGTAPLSPRGHINISPKGSSTGGPAFGVLSPTQFWYVDLTGSGIETHAHLHEPNNGRICVMVTMNNFIFQTPTNSESLPLSPAPQRSSAYGALAHPSNTARQHSPILSPNTAFQSSRACAAS